MHSFSPCQYVYIVCILVSQINIIHAPMVTALYIDLVFCLYIMAFQGNFFHTEELVVHITVS